MTEQLIKAREQVLQAVQGRIVEIMARVVERSKAEIAEAVLADCTDPFNEGTLNDAIVDQLDGWDFSGEVNLVTAEVPASVKATT